MSEHTPERGFGNPEFEHEIPDLSATAPATTQEKALTASWRRINKLALSAAEMVIHMAMPPDIITVPYRAFNARPLEVDDPQNIVVWGWNVIRDAKEHQAQPWMSPSYNGLLLLENGGLALYNIELPDEKPVSELNFIYKATPHIDTPPANSMVYLSKDTPPHPESYVHQLTQTLPGTTAQTQGLPAVHLALEFFRATLTT